MFFGGIGIVPTGYYVILNDLFVKIRLNCEKRNKLGNLVLTVKCC